MLSEEVENHLRSLDRCVWLVGVERCSSITNDLVRRVVTTTPGVKAVILAAYQRPDDILAVLKAGACGFLCQDISGEELIKSLELIAHDEMVVHPQFSRAQTAVGQTQANGELEANRALQANSGIALGVSWGRAGAARCWHAEVASGSLQLQIGNYLD